MALQTIPSTPTSVTVAIALLLARPSPVSHDGLNFLGSSGNPCACHLGQHLQDVLLDRADMRLDLLQRAGRRVAVEVAVEMDLVADDATFPVLGIALLCVDPG